jgi:hypothetical protein
MSKIQQMVPNDDEKGYGKTSLKMTRSLAEDIALKVRKIKRDIDDGTVNLTYSEWQEFISYCWSDDIWIMAFNKAIEMCKKANIDLNKNVEFLAMISERTPSELKNEFKKTHPIARMSLMDIIDKKPKKDEPEKELTVEDMFP